MPVVANIIKEFSVDLVATPYWHFGVKQSITGHWCGREIFNTAANLHEYLYKCFVYGRVNDPDQVVVNYTYSPDLPHEPSVVWKKVYTARKWEAGCEVHKPKSLGLIPPIPCVYCKTKCLQVQECQHGNSLMCRRAMNRSQSSLEYVQPIRYEELTVHEISECFEDDFSFTSDEEMPEFINL